jgi:hypothetical protein
MSVMPVVVMSMVPVRTVMSLMSMLPVRTVVAVMSVMSTMSISIVTHSDVCVVNYALKTVTFSMDILY